MYDLEKHAKTCITIKLYLVIMNKLDSMAVFVRVVEKGSFTAVAEEMRISSTMIGLHIKGLEQHLGVRLLNRTTRRQSLTDFGHDYYQRCQQILADIRDAESLASRQHQQPQGLLRVACPVSLGVHVLAALNARFQASWPDVTLDIRLSDRPLDMAEDGIDVMLKIGELEQVNSLVARRLADYRSVVCASPAYLEAFGTPAHPEQLIDHRCLGFAHPLASGRWQFIDADKPFSVPVKLVMSINNGEALRRAALQGCGIIMQPEVLLADDLRSGHLIRLFNQMTTPARPVHLLTFADRQQLPKIRHYVDHLRLHLSHSLIDQ
ncbi:transcriptional regulator, LysR family (plasmid) [Pantoea sp. At-9b]|nr:transcriptional regulator, LysR family [Pantoea sp. At-9b]